MYVSIRFIAASLHFDVLHHLKAAESLSQTSDSSEPSLTSGSASGCKEAFSVIDGGPAELLINPRNSAENRGHSCSHIPFVAQRADLILQTSASL